MEGSSSTTSTKCGFSKAGVEVARFCGSKLFCAETVVVIARTFFEFWRVSLTECLRSNSFWTRLLTGAGLRLFVSGQGVRLVLLGLCFPLQEELVEVFDLGLLS